MSAAEKGWGGAREGQAGQQMPGVPHREETVPSRTFLGNDKGRSAHAQVRRTRGSGEQATWQEEGLTHQRPQRRSLSQEGGWGGQPRARRGGATPHRSHKVTRACSAPRGHSTTLPGRGLLPRPATSNMRWKPLHPALTLPLSQSSFAQFYGQNITELEKCFKKHA